MHRGVACATVADPKPPTAVDHANTAYNMILFYAQPMLGAAGYCVWMVRLLLLSGAFTPLYLASSIQKELLMYTYRMGIHIYGDVQACSNFGVAV